MSKYASLLSLTSSIYSKNQYFFFLLVALRPPQMESQVVNRTVRTCCEGWTGPRCSEGQKEHVCLWNFNYVFSINSKA